MMGETARTWSTRQKDPRIVVAEAQAELVCQQALERTPPAYLPYLLLLPQTKKLAEGVFVTIKVPYMGVDGRVKMARDEHQEKGATLRMQTSFMPEPGTGQTVCKAEVESSLYGSATGHARVFTTGGGFADKTNPLETAETSAIGRALGFLGYGLYGTGIASAEEVLTAQQQRGPDGVDPATGDVQEGPPASERQRAFLRSLLEQLNLPAAEIEKQITQVTGSSRAASERITQLRDQRRAAEREPGEEG